MALGSLDHEVHVEHRTGLAHLFGEARDDERTDGDRGDEVPVHHVDVDHAGTRRQHLSHLLAQAPEVGREDGGRHANPGKKLARTSGHIGCSIESPQLLHCSIAVEDILTIVECSPQLGHTEVSSKRCRQYTQR